MTNNYDVFISYRRSDGTELAKKVRDRLEKRGFRVFLDERDLPGGQDFDKELERHILATPNYILIATPDVFKFRSKDDWVLREIQIALKAYESDNSRHIYPIMSKGFSMPEADRLPESIKALHLKNGLNLKTDEPTDENYAQIARVISAVNRRNMWNAGHRYLAQSKSAGRRFHSLHIDERIMPLASDSRQSFADTDLPIHVQKDGNSGHPVKLGEAIKSTSSHIYLIGEGGIGKTTAMISMMEDAYEKMSYSDTAQIPLFVELNRAPEQSKWYQSGEKLESTFIRRELARILLSADSIVHVPADYISSIEKEFCKKTSSPEYLLLLDGLNEVSIEKVQDESGKGLFIRTLIINEIIHLMQNCPNVRIVLTSRTDETEIDCEEFNISKLHLTGVDGVTIKEYLKGCKISAEVIDKAIHSKNLLECLRIPLFLTIFGKLSETKEISSRGEILKQFFHERSRQIYSQQSRIKEFHIDTNETHLLFILDFLLPAIGSYMEKNNEFYISDEKISEIIRTILGNKIADQPIRRNNSKAAAEIDYSKKPGLFSRVFGKKTKTESTAYIYEDHNSDVIYLQESDTPSPTAIIGEYGRQCFRQYAHYRTDTAEIASEILAKGNSLLEAAIYVRKCCVWVMGLLQESGGKYCFIHHHIRDYFAAVHEINIIRLGVYLNTENPALAFSAISPLTQEANHKEKSIFIGEILGEHHNIPYFIKNEWQYNVPTKPCDRNLIKRTLEIFRNKFGEEVGYGVFNLIEILKLVRRDLSYEDLSNLDLSLVSLCDVRLGHSQSFGANLFGSKLSMKNLLHKSTNTSIRSVATDHSGKCFVSCFEDGLIKEWDIKSGSILHTYEGHSGWVNHVVYSPDNTMIASASNDHTIRIWDRKTEACLSICTGHLDAVVSVRFRPDNKTIISASNDGSIKNWDVKSGLCLTTYLGHNRGINCIAYSPDGRNFLSGSMDMTIKKWDATTGMLRWSCNVNKAVLCIAYSPDGTRFACAFDDNTICECDERTGKCIQVIDSCKHSGYINALAYSQANGNLLLSASDDGTIKLWDFSVGQCLFTYVGHKDRVISLSFLPDMNSFISGSIDSTIIMWNFLTGKPIKTYDISYRITSLAVSADQSRIFSSSTDTTIKEWNASTGQCVRTYEGHSRCVNSIAYNPNTNTFISGSDDKSVKEWDTVTGEILYTYAEHDREVTSVAVNNNGNTFISGSSDGTVKEWHVGQKQSLFTYECIDSDVAINTVAYYPNGKIILAGLSNGSIVEWSVGRIHPAAVYSGHTKAVTCIKIHPNGTDFISSSEDNSIMLWKKGVKKPFAMLNEHTDSIIALDYSFDFRYLISYAKDERIKIWDLSKRESICTHREDHIVSLFGGLYNGSFLTGCSNNLIEKWEGIKQWEGRSYTEVDKPYRVYEERLYDANTISYGKSSESFITGYCDGTIKEWNASSTSCVRIFTGHNWYVTSLSYSPNFQTFISGSFDGTIKEWNSSNDQEVGSYNWGIDDTSLTPRVDYVFFHPDGKHFYASASSTEMHRIKEWCIGASQHTTAYGDSLSTSVSNSPNGKRLIAAFSQITEWNSGNKEPVQTYFLQNDCLFISTTYSSDSKSILASCYIGNHCEVVHWKVGNTQPLFTYDTKDYYIKSLQCRFDDKFFIGIANDMKIFEWQFGKKEAIREYEVNDAIIRSVAYSPDGRFILSCSDNGIVRIWSTETGDCIKLFHNYPGLIVLGCDMRQLHEGSSIDKGVLRQYGAIVD